MWLADWRPADDGKEDCSFVRTTSSVAWLLRGSAHDTGRETGRRSRTQPGGDGDREEEEDDDDRGS